MKKIFILLMLLGTYLFVSVDLFAYTFNGSYDFSNIDLDASLNELNGASLNDLFDYDYLDTIPLIEWNGYRNKFELDGNQVVFNEYIYIDLGYKNIFNINSVRVGYIILSSNGQLYYTNTNNSSNYIQVLPNTTYTMSGNSFSSAGNGFAWYDNNFNFISGGGTFNIQTSPSNATYLRFTYGVNDSQIQLEEGNVITEYKPYGVLSEIYRLNSTPIVNSDMTNALLFYNLENINIDLLNYYFAVFLLNAYDLPVGDLFNYAFNAGYNNGYEDGDFQGQIDGFARGQSYYHTGYSYSIYDFRESQSYNIGYNEGGDYVATNNISLLSVFQMIIGVVMSMLGFIINIELFGISIASVLGTLAIGIAIIWTLKLIRG